MQRGHYGRPADGRASFQKARSKSRSARRRRSFSATRGMQYIDHFPMNRDEDPVNMTLREIVYHNATEWQVIDQMCAIFYAIKGMPLEFFLDLVAPHLG